MLVIRYTDPIYPSLLIVVFAMRLEEVYRESTVGSEIQIDSTCCAAIEGKKHTVSSPLPAILEMIFTC